MCVCRLTVLHVPEKVDKILEGNLWSLGPALFHCRHQFEKQSNGRCMKKCVSTRYNFKYVYI